MVAMRSAFSRHPASLMPRLSMRALRSLTDMLLRVASSGSCWAARLGGLGAADCAASAAAALRDGGVRELNAELPWLDASAAVAPPPPKEAAAPAPCGGCGTRFIMA